MKVLVVGSGAREHALATKLAASERVDEVFIAPGNAGTAEVGENLAIEATDVAALTDAAVKREIGLVVVGPEAPLSLGLTDFLRQRDVLVFGPSRAAAELEVSKGFAKDFMKRHRIPTAAYGVFTDRDAAHAFVQRNAKPMVVKADGLAGGKGVVVAESLAETFEAIDAFIVDRVLGEAGARLVIEERLVGPEVSYHVVSDGTRFVPLVAAQDHKRLGDGDRGPNTGGMGAYSPPPMVDDALEREILERVVRPTLDGMRADGVPFSGALFTGLMIVDGAPKVLEYNVRFGDPETAVIMARLESDVLPLLLGAASGDLSGVELVWGAPAALAVVMAAAGYPDRPERGALIHGISDARTKPHVTVYEAATRADAAGTRVDGGRVLCVTAVGDDVRDAAACAYRGVDAISFEGAQFRRDIGHQAR